MSGPTETLPPLGALERIGLQQVVRDAGFDLLEDLPCGVAARSTQAPLRVWVLRPPSPDTGWWLGLSMPQVAPLLDGTAIAMPPALEGAVAWRAVTGRHALDAALVRAWQLSRSLPDTLEQRWKQRLQSLPATEREATVRRRVGQDLFRDGLMALWQGRCAITGLDEPALLRASHAKPWADATDAERLDVHNGLLLAAHWDAAFDAGLVGVEPDGRIVFSPRLRPAALGMLTADATHVAGLQPAHRPYLHWHRQHVFRAG